MIEAVELVGFDRRLLDGLEFLLACSELGDLWRSNIGLGLFLFVRPGSLFQERDLRALIRPRVDDRELLQPGAQHQRGAEGQRGQEGQREERRGQAEQDVRDGSGGGLLFFLLVVRPGLGAPAGTEGHESAAAADHGDGPRRVVDGRRAVDDDGADHDPADPGDDQPRTGAAPPFAVEVVVESPCAADEERGLQQERQQHERNAEDDVRPGHRAAQERDMSVQPAEDGRCLHRLHPRAERHKDLIEDDGQEDAVDGRHQQFPELFLPDARTFRAHLADV